LPPRAGRPREKATDLPGVVSAGGSAREVKMKVYTGGGDRGKTSLFSGERLAKHHRRIASYGAVDELNSVLGALVGALPPSADSAVADGLRRIQSDLFHLGARLATVPGSALGAAIREIRPSDHRFLEEAIDRMDAELAPLTSFVLPGGHPAAAWAHVARTVCRRAERKVVRLAVEDKSESLQGLEGIISYLNRLSDYLFTLARFCNHATATADIPWKK
jgi:cob(I)alamin adenosyltransferase